LDKHYITHFLNKTTAESFQILNNSPTYPNECNKFNTELVQSILRDSLQENSKLGTNKVRKKRRKTVPKKERQNIKKKE
jgi:hypothetical protein